MKGSHKLAMAVATASLVIVACHKVPYTGRIQYNLVPDAIMRQLGRTSYTQALAGAPVEKRGEDYATLVKVGDGISRVAKQPSYDWEFSLVDEPEMNAWCMPGGYIAFYTGILPVLQNEAGMAFVMGHEVGHAVARHGSERLSQQLTVFGGLTALELYLANETEVNPKTRGLILGALGLGTEVAVLLPFSRTHESEADVIGMMYMAGAGYPPTESIAIWDRMERASPTSTPAFLSTHPPNERRQDNLEEWLPQATKKYERNKLPYDTKAPLWGGLETAGAKVPPSGSRPKKKQRPGSVTDPGEK